MTELTMKMLDEWAESYPGALNPIEYSLLIAAARKGLEAQAEIERLKAENQTLKISWEMVRTCLNERQAQPSVDQAKP